MTTQTLTAVFEKGVFRPVAPSSIHLAEGQQVRLTLEASEPSPDVLLLAQQVYAGFSDSQIKEIEHIILDRRDFFSDRELL